MPAPTDTPHRASWGSVAVDGSQLASLRASWDAASARPVNGAIRGPPPTAGGGDEGADDLLLGDDAPPRSTSPSHHRAESNAPPVAVVFPDAGYSRADSHRHLFVPARPLWDVVRGELANSGSPLEEPIPDELCAHAQWGGESDAGDDDAARGDGGRGMVEPEAGDAAVLVAPSPPGRRRGR
jgi:hypothetical protein